MKTTAYLKFFHKGGTIFWSLGMLLWYILGYIVSTTNGLDGLGRLLLPKPEFLTFLTFGTGSMWPGAEWCIIESVTFFGGMIGLSRDRDWLLGNLDSKKRHKFATAIRWILTIPAALCGAIVGSTLILALLPSLPSVILDPLIGIGAFWFMYIVGIGVAPYNENTWAFLWIGIFGVFLSLLWFLYVFKNSSIGNGPALSSVTCGIMSYLLTTLRQGE